MHIYILHSFLRIASQKKRFVFPCKSAKIAVRLPILALYRAGTSKTRSGSHFGMMVDGGTFLKKEICEKRVSKILTFLKNM